MSVRPLKGMSAQSVTSAFMDTCKLLGVPYIVITDNGKEFEEGMNVLIKSYMEHCEVAY
ncbi:hypothetical protein Pmar_PMAR022721 [Perkinsus marinus ATCC 50983]|uniref:Uncharacterized protein n=1 Tax=Perkinsus marinus (strain ATCC 50983 / TXsc) TaxID=423536 RepID=C5K463_PERM5|nr:hypothetical protein Pmar_PMAR013844 [Perkinsus marinus ATCC 50983]XP_002788934.1 hypothetical protein Pmar_PMAR022721 [Perkinsus marinus ATCC 50983]EEQ97666.1 hypothetical protein Pmar_PMAR013844 [Perkinsus marinus ATCC 50983]EER20730.1 hypothetical protein Pmar_PMAR022721 [Perkinsus marinus ATCC 50983]|eukprot:XP_002764949.1 hypothetical protein Pmar_PMAR013844 [Perkinsus marinus ATCC 50983]